MALGIAVRGSQGLYMLTGGPRFDEESEANSGFTPDVSKNCKVMRFDAFGNRFVYSDGNDVRIASKEKGTPDVWRKRKLDGPTGRTTFLLFSPKGTVLCSWEPFAKFTAKKEGEEKSKGGEDNVRLWDAASGQLLYSYIHRKAEGWAPQWTEDEVWCCHRSPNNEVHFFKENRFDRPLPARLSIKNLDSYFLSPKVRRDAAGPCVASYLPGQRGGPGFCKLFGYPNFDSERDSLATKSFMTADKMEAKWSPADGQNVLILAQSDVDKTGSSYYGKSQLHFANVDGDTAMVSLEKEGPVYSVEWKPTKPAEFIVVYGYMPARATLFNRKCEAIFNLGTGPRNMALWNPQGNLVLVGGFGNLRGNIEIWSMTESKKKVAQFEAADTTDVRWSPDGQHLLTSTCAPRLRTGNGFKVWHYTSTLLHEKVLVNTRANPVVKPDAIAAPTVDELWETAWQPVPEGTYPDDFVVLEKPIKGGMKSATPQASKQAYRPPGARGIPPSSNPNEDPPNIAAGTYKKPGNRVPVGMAPQQANGGIVPKKPHNPEKWLKLKLERQKKREEKAEERKRLGLPEPEPFPVVPRPTGDKEKDVRKLAKKISAIGKLKKRLAAGERLEINQLEKIKKEAELVAELEKLQLS